jgi:hypothetical protein
MAGIRRAKGTAPAAKAPTLTEDIRAMLGTLRGTKHIQPKTSVKRSPPAICRDFAAIGIFI